MEGEKGILHPSVTFLTCKLPVKVTVKLICQKYLT